MLRALNADVESTARRLEDLAAEIRSGSVVGVLVIALGDDGGRFVTSAWATRDNEVAALGLIGAAYVELTDVARRVAIEAT